ncbi:Gag-Pol polyprotein [Plakobranchus ocellatus]|uniref:Gag-Pol polyprotein n=1 Tax=Plakobranchus ocellatus TaxID=259542 RepID=A0AAV4C5J5_9GAST|nr:Gag-Pol polyprotein [Plakobranchus ocellatus]
MRLCARIELATSSFNVYCSSLNHRVCTVLVGQMNGDLQETHDSIITNQRKYQTYDLVTFALRVSQVRTSNGIIATANDILLPRESRYSVIEREALALVFAVTQLQRYLAFNHYILQTDHKPLAYLRAGSPKNARLIRWALAFQEFSFQVVHIPGSENVHADVLSRLC